MSFRSAKLVNLSFGLRPKFGLQSKLWSQSLVSKSEMKHITVSAASVTCQLWFCVASTRSSVISCSAPINKRWLMETTSTSRLICWPSTTTRGAGSLATPPQTHWHDRPSSLYCRLVPAHICLKVAENSFKTLEKTLKTWANLKKTLKRPIKTLPIFRWIDSSGWKLTIR